MPVIEEITTAFTGFLPSASAILLWSGYILLGGICIVAAILISYLNSFNYKIRYWTMIGEIGESGSSEGLTIDKLKTNRAKWNKEKSSWILMKPFLANKTIHPFDARDIYAGNTVYAFKMHEDYIPARIMYNNVLKTISINPIPFYIKNWQQIELKQNEVEFAKSGWWEQNKFYLMTIITVGACLALAAITIYLTFRFAAPAKESIQGLTNVIEGLSRMGGKPT